MDATKIKAKFSSKFQKRVPPLVDGELEVELMHGNVKLLITHEGRSFWMYVDPIELAEAAMMQVPVVRGAELVHLNVFESYMRISKADKED